MKFWKAIPLIVFLFTSLSITGFAWGQCSSGNCNSTTGPLALPRLAIGNAQFSIGIEQSITGCYGSITQWGDVESNASGSWYRINDRPGWKVVSGPDYEGVSGNYTKVSFEVQDVANNTFYYYEQAGDPNWASTAEIISETYGKIPLARQSRTSGGTSLISYSYDSFGRITRQTSGSDGLIIYGYTDPNDPDATLNRIWAGTDILDYDDRPSDPTSGRWVDVDYSSTTGKLIYIKHGCGSCGAGERTIEYVASQTILNYDPSSNPGFDPNFKEDPNTWDYDPVRDPNNYQPGDYLISKIKGANVNQMLISYDYDSKDRLVNQWLGESPSGLHAIENTFLTYNFYDPNDQNIHTHIKRLYTDNTNYRAIVLLQTSSGTTYEEHRYHDLQSGSQLTGKYSIYSYEYGKDTYGRLTKFTTTLPKGNKTFNDYHATYNDVIASKRSDYKNTSVLIEAEYTYHKTNYGDGYALVLTESKDAHGNSTTYDYETNWMNVKKQTDPAVQVWNRPACCDCLEWEFMTCVDPPDYCYGTNPLCTTPSQQQITNYEYNSRNQTTKETRKDANGNDVVTRYAYDPFGNMLGQFEGWSLIDCDPNDPNNCDISKVNVTQYLYNEYHEPVQVTDPTRTIRKTYYSTSGAVVAEAVCDKTDPNNLISATKYIYDTNGWLETKSVANENSAFTEVNLLHDLDYPLSPNITWVNEDTIYDTYGRRTDIIADVGGKELRTQYAYNNQGEITQITFPTGRFAKTIRDGRGLVSQKIIGYDQTEVATTQFFYDFNGNLVKKIDPEGVTEHYDYDDFDRLIRTRKGQ